MRDNFINDDFDLEQSIEQPKAVIDPNEDENANRYGLSFLINIPLYKHIGNNILVDVNRLDEYGNVVKNQQYFPRLTLIPFKKVSAPIPSEAPASSTSSGSYEANMRPFNPEVADAQDAMIRRVHKSALKCAELFLNVYGKDGGMIVNSLTGAETYSDAKAALLTILPLANTEIFPRTTRNILGEQFTAPFLDQILDYLQSGEVQTRIEQTARTEDQHKRLLSIYQEVLIGARNANTVAKGQIATTEQQMAASPQQKSAYDSRDTLFRDSPDPFDLVCLAHLNEIPKSERQLAQARKMQETSNEPLKDVAASMNQVAALMVENQRNAQVSQSPVGMTAAEISELVKTQVAQGIEEFKQQSSAAQAESGANTAAKTNKKQI